MSARWIRDGTESQQARVEQIKISSNAASLPEMEGIANLETLCHSIAATLIMLIDADVKYKSFPNEQIAKQS